MSFHFSLETILNLRRSVEHQEELRLRAVHQALRKVRHQIELLDSRIHQQKGQVREEVEKGTTGAEIQFHLQTQTGLQLTRKGLERESAKLEKVCVQQQQRFRHARQQREILESLREQRLSTYERERLRRDQRALDELYLLRLPNKLG